MRLDTILFDLLYVEVIAHESTVGSNQPDKKTCRMF